MEAWEASLQDPTAWPAPPISPLPLPEQEADSGWTPACVGRAPFPLVSVMVQGRFQDSAPSQNTDPTSWQVLSPWMDQTFAHLQRSVLTYFALFYKHQYGQQLLTSNTVTPPPRRRRLCLETTWRESEKFHKSTFF